MEATEYSMISATTLLWVTIGGIVAALIGLTVYLVMGRADTRPVKQGFYGGVIPKTTDFPCSEISKEATELYSIFASKNMNVAEEGKADLNDLRNLVSKLCCFKKDLMAPEQTVTSVKELGFITQQDIQPVNDLTGRCFSKTISDRDLSIQFIKWREVGNMLIHRLCTEGKLSEIEVIRAENLFSILWNDAHDTATSKCLSVLPKETQYRFDAIPMETKDVSDLKKYDGLY